MDTFGGVGELELFVLEGRTMHAMGRADLDGLFALEVLKYPFTRSSLMSRRLGPSMLNETYGPFAFEPLEIKAGQTAAMR